MEEKNGTLGNQTEVFWVPSPNLSTIAAGRGNDLVGLLKPPLFKLPNIDDPEHSSGLEQVRKAVLIVSCCN